MVLKPKKFGAFRQGITPPTNDLAPSGGQHDLTNVEINT